MSQQFDFSQILDALQEPFPSHEVEFKPGATNREKTKALALAYVDSRPYIQRLNLVCPDWQDEYQVMMLPDRVVVLCRLTIAGVTRTGDGECLLSGGEEGDRAEPNAVTTASAQAFKRACVKFGLGAYLYALPQVWCDYDAQKRKIVNPPQLPEWALAPSERLEKSTRDAVQREAAERGLPAPEPSQPDPAEPGKGELADPGAYKMPFGKYNGSTLSEIWQSKEGQGYVRWLAGTGEKGFQPRNPTDQNAQRMARAFLSVNAAYAG
ncbi:Rad52/Rad22 family DNA repair protein [Anaerolinea sp.]|uniref:Rad52/Rad22 family DNA repair protein n=1 Tax=Anaerolinea sp. TaxID=1872519 RepID=UPI002ACE5C7D|nr:Rad52/Rad22 family DNA repair protein [Anaerolinea sp.]